MQKVESEEIKIRAISCDNLVLLREVSQLVLRAEPDYFHQNTKIKNPIETLGYYLTREISFSKVSAPECSNKTLILGAFINHNYYKPRAILILRTLDNRPLSYQVLTLACHEDLSVEHKVKIIQLLFKTAKNFQRKYTSQQLPSFFALRPSTESIDSLSAKWMGIKLIYCGNSYLNNHSINLIKLDTTFSTNSNMKINIEKTLIGNAVNYKPTYQEIIRPFNETSTTDTVKFS